MGVARPFCAALAALQLVFDLLHACHQAPTRVLTDLRMSVTIQADPESRQRTVLWGMALQRLQCPCILGLCPLLHAVDEEMHSADIPCEECSRSSCSHPQHRTNAYFMGLGAKFYSGST